MQVTIKPKMTVYYDSFAGLVQCRVVDWSETTANLTVSKDQQGGYRKGEKLNVIIENLVVRKAIVKRRFHIKLKHIDWVVPKFIAPPESAWDQHVRETKNEISSLQQRIKNLKESIA